MRDNLLLPHLYDHVPYKWGSAASMHIFPSKSQARLLRTAITVIGSFLASPTQVRWMFGHWASWRSSASLVSLPTIDLKLWRPWLPSLKTASPVSWRVCAALAVVKGLLTGEIMQIEGIAVRRLRLYSAVFSAPTHPNHTLLSLSLALLPSLPSSLPTYLPPSFIHSITPPSLSLRPASPPSPLPRGPVCECVWI